METLPLEEENEVFYENSWATFDTTLFPNVKVIMSGVIEKQKDFDDFVNQWRNLYNMNQGFVLEFDTTNVGTVSMKYAFQMRNFIRELKSNYPKLLQKSHIKVKSKWVRFLLKIIFFFEKPVADVYIENINDNSISIVKC